jgi:large repetitive protein
MVEKGQTIQRREAMKLALKGGAYAAPVILASTIPSAVSAATPPPSADLQVTFTLTTPTPTVGTVETIRVIVTNLGPITATNVVVNGNLFIFGFAAPTFAVTQGSLNPITGAWTNPSLAVGAAAILTVTGTVTAVGARTANVGIVSSDQPDPSTANNNVSITITGTP